MISASSLRALADATACLPGLTETELGRVVAFIGALRRERTSTTPIVRDAVDAAVPCLEALSSVMDRLSDLDEAFGTVDRLASLGPDQALTVSESNRAEMRALVNRLAGLLDVLVGIDGTELQALTLLLRAHRDGEPPT